MVSLLLLLVFVFFSDGEDDDSFDDAAAEVNNLLVLVVVVGVRRAPFPPFPPPRKGLFSFLVFSPPPRQEGRNKSTLLGEEEEEEEEEENIIISLCVMLFFPVRKNFCWCFPTVFSNENFWAIDRRIFGLFFLIKRKLKNTSSRGTHHIITRAHKKKNDDDENDDDFEENDFDSSLPLRRELFVWDFNCFCRAGIPRQRAFLCVVFFLDHFSQNHHHRRVLAALFVFFFSSSRSPHSAPLPARRRRLRRVLSVCRGRSRFEGCFSRKFFFCFFFSTKTEDWRKKWVLLDDVGKNTNHFIETLFSRGAKNTNHQNVCFSTLMT